MQSSLFGFGFPKSPNDTHPSARVIEDSVASPAYYFLRFGRSPRSQIVVGDLRLAQW